MDILCVLHDSDEYGICRWPLADLARSANVSLKLVKELVLKDVLKGSDAAAKPYIFTPRHAGKDGTPIVLVENLNGPMWYCSRFVRDEYIRQKRGNSTQFSSDNQPPPKAVPKTTPKPPIGEREGDGSTSSSTSTLKPSSKALALASRLPTDWQPSEADVLFCKQERSDLNLKSVSEQFRDYWIAQPGVKGRKTDWPATWRNWVRNQKTAFKPANRMDISNIDYKQGVNPDGSF